MYDYGNEFKIPVIFICGSEDWMTRYTIEDYYDSVKAPYKKLISMQGIGHNTLLVEPQEFYMSFNYLLQSILGNS